MRQHDGSVCDAVAASRRSDEAVVAVTFDDGEQGRYDLVWLATGGTLDLSLVPILASLQAQRPIGVSAGLPHLQPDLAWDGGCPMHVMGAFAQLELGPDALNLAGARSGSVIVAKAILECSSCSGSACSPPAAPGAVPHGAIDVS